MLRNGTGSFEGGEAMRFMSSIDLLVTNILLLGSAMGRYIHVVNSECLCCSGTRTWRGSYSVRFDPPHRCQW